MEKISIVMPSLNVASFIKECIESVIQQTLSDIEIICVDAGSTDGTLEILEDYAKKDDRIIILHSDIKSYGHQVNMGMEKATGEYVAIVETDDVVNIKMYEILYDVAKKTQVDIVKADFAKFVINNGVLERSEQKIAKDFLYNRILTHKDDYKDIITNASLFTWAGIYKRDFLVKNDLKHNETLGASYQDNGFWFLTMSKAESVYFVNQSFYMLRRDNPNSSINNKGKVYIIFDEYEYIKKVISTWVDLYEEILPFYWWARFGATRYHYRRVDNKFKKEFLLKFKSVYDGPYNSGLIRKDIFSKKSYSDLEMIIKNPMRFNKIYLRSEKRINKKSSLLNKVLWSFEDRGVRETFRIINSRLFKMGKSKKVDIKLYNNLKKYMTARFDIKNEGSESNKVVLSYKKSKDIKEYTPSWFVNEKGSGLVLESSQRVISFTIKCVGDGVLYIKLRSLDFKDSKKNKIPLICFSKLEINGKNKLNNYRYTSFDDAFKLKRDVKDGDFVTVKAEWELL